MKCITSYKPHPSKSTTDSDPPSENPGSAPEFTDEIKTIIDYRLLVDIIASYMMLHALDKYIKIANFFQFSLLYQIPENT